MNRRSKELSLKRAALKAAMAAGGMDKLMLPTIATMADGSTWIPLGLVAQRQPSPVRVTRKGIPKYELREERRKSAWKGTPHRTPPPWWER